MARRGWGPGLTPLPSLCRALEEGTTWVPGLGGGAAGSRAWVRILKGGVVLELRPLGGIRQSAGDSGIQAKTQTEINSARDQYRPEQPWGSRSWGW